MCLAIPGRVKKTVEIDGLRFAEIDFDGLEVRACMELVPEAQTGDFVLVHAGMALQIVDEEEAHKTLALLKEITEIERKDNV